MKGPDLKHVPDEFIKQAAVLEENHALPQHQAHLLLLVEMGFTLQEELGFTDEPITAVWVLLSGMPVREMRLNDLTAEQRRLLANARQMVPYTSRGSWEAALTQYFRLSEELRNCRSDELNWEDALLVTSFGHHHRANRQVCLQALQKPFEFAVRSVQQVKPGKTYLFDAPGQEEYLRVRFEECDLKGSERFQNSFSLPRSRQVEAFRFSRDDLRETAAFLDTREAVLQQEWGEKVIQKGNWQGRLSVLDYREVDDRLEVSGTQDEVIIKGFVHVAGMVASGKSTLALLIAAHLLRTSEKRVTLVVGTTAQAISLAHQINTWFSLNPIRDTPLAVPLMGRSSRDQQLQNFLSSREQQNHLATGMLHWGERWLATGCPLQGLAREQHNAEEAFPLTPGREPCERLHLPRRRKPGGPEEMGASHVCPLFHRCPSQQVFRDLPGARVWITTPAGLVRGRLPRQMEARDVHFGEVVYGLSDLVIVDEADSVMQWMDQTFAETVHLTRRGDGVFDRLLFPVAQTLQENRVLHSDQMNWVKAQADAQTVTGSVLALLQDHPQAAVLKKWVERGYFTPAVLLYRIARRMCGLFDFFRREEKDLEDQQEGAVEAIMKHFSVLLEPQDVLRSTNPSREVQGLMDIMQEINLVGDSAVDVVIHQKCLNWL